MKFLLLSLLSFSSNAQYIDPAYLLMVHDEVELTGAASCKIARIAEPDMVFQAVLNTRVDEDHPMQRQVASRTFNSTNVSLRLTVQESTDGQKYCMRAQFVDSTGRTRSSEHTNCHPKRTQNPGSLPEKTVLGIADSAQHLYVTAECTLLARVTGSRHVDED